MPHSIYTKAWLKKEQAAICWTICFIQVLFFIYGHWDRSFHRQKCLASSESPNKYLIPSNTALSLVTIMVSGQISGSGRRFDLAGYILEDWGHVLNSTSSANKLLWGSAIPTLVLAMGWADHSLGREPLCEMSALFESAGLWPFAKIVSCLLIPVCFQLEKEKKQETSKPNIYFIPYNLPPVCFFLHNNCLNLSQC